MLHALTSIDTLRDITLPALRKGLAAAGRSRDEVDLYAPTFVITGDTDEEMETADRAVRLQLAFYASTPAYRAVLRFHGFADLPEQLNALSKQGRWKDMGGLIGDDVLELFSVTGKPEEIGPAILTRFGGLLDRVALYAPYRHTDSSGTRRPPSEPWARVLPGFTPR